MEISQQSEVYIHFINTYHIALSRVCNRKYMTVMTMNIIAIDMCIKDDKTNRMMEMYFVPFEVLDHGLLSRLL